MIEGFRRRTLSASGLSLVDQFVKIASALVVSPVIIGALGQEKYGLWVLMFSILGYAELLDLGLQQTSIRFLSRAIGGGKPAELASLFRTLHRLYARIGGGIALLWPLAATLLALQFERPFRLQSGIILGLLGLTQALTFSLRAYPALLKANLRFSLVIGTSTVRTILFSAFILGFSGERLDLYHLLAAHVTLQIAEQACLFFRSRPFVPRDWKSAAPLEKEGGRDLRAFAGKNMVGSLTGIVRDRIDPQLLAGLVTLGAVTQHAVGVRLPLMFLGLQTALFGSHFMAAFSQMAGSDREGDHRALCLAAIRFASIPALTAGVGMWLLGPAFILRWLGPDFGIAGTVTQWVGASLCLVGAQYPLFSYMAAINRYGRLVGVTLAVSLVRAAVSVWAIRRFGVLGAAGCAAGEALLHAFITYPLLGSAALGKSLPSYLAQTVLKPTACMALTALPVGWWLCGTLRPDSYALIALCAAAICTVAALTGWLLILNQADRHTVTSFLLSRQRTAAV